MISIKKQYCIPDGRVAHITEINSALEYPVQGYIFKDGITFKELPQEWTMDGKHKDRAEYNLNENPNPWCLI